MGIKEVEHHAVYKKHFLNNNVVADPIKAKILYWNNTRVRVSVQKKYLNYLKEKSKKSSIHKKLLRRINIQRKKFKRQTFYLYYFHKYLKAQKQKKKNFLKKKNFNKKSNKL